MLSEADLPALSCREGMPITMKNLVKRCLPTTVHVSLPIYFSVIKSSSRE